MTTTVLELNVSGMICRACEDAIADALLHTRRRFAGRPLIIGLLTGVMPCGALSAMWLCAMSSGSAARGALVMLVFSLGTVPLLFLFGALQSFLPRGWMKYIVKGSAVLVVTLGLSMLVKGIRLFGM